MKSDIWSCGVILYVLLAGFLPFKHENLMKMYRKVFKGEYEFPPCFPLKAKKLISKLLVADPEKRITIPAVTRVPWFLKEFSRSSSFSSIEENTDQKQESLEPNLGGRSKSVPPFYNAFELYQQFPGSICQAFSLKVRGNLAQCSHPNALPPRSCQSWNL
ncbi:CBL-interacting serine/threonine-protein kinase 16 [Datura stramonium]|uniref:CBL-interacting serine/threonine-protein kinase 16 n=1 Tax=Datura stramonium TaxID=4076 RepID=A0ABS8SPH8_DATST|nr:CBL-interacting serine/threonine-protein kinase 16 [Datura stramonium]